MVCLLGRPWHPVLSGPWNWPAYLPSLSGKRAYLYSLAIVNTSSLTWLEWNTGFTDILKMIISSWNKHLKIYSTIFICKNIRTFMKSLMARDLSEEGKKAEMK